jgi:O-antigen ligase
LAALVSSDPFSLSYYIHGTAITLPKTVLVGVTVGLLVRALRLRSAVVRQAHHDEILAEALSLSKGHHDDKRTLWLLLGAQLAFIVTMVLASVHAFSHAAAMRETLKALQYVLTLVVAYFAYRSDPEELRLRTAFAAVTSLVAVLALAEEFTGAIESTMIHGHVFARIAGPLEGPNQLAAFLGVVLPIVLAFAVLRTPLMLERFALAAGALACVLTISRGGIAALIVAIVLLLLLRYLPNAARAIGMSAVALFAAVLGFACLEFAGLLHGGALSIFGGTADRYNGGLGSRPDLWHGAYAMWRSHPVFGVGPGNFELLISKYAPGVHTHANSIYFQTLAEQGLLGALALVGVIGASIAAFVKRLREPLALGACIAAVTMAFHQIVDGLWIYPKVGVVFWIVLAAGAACVDAYAVRNDESVEEIADLTPASSSCSIA